MPYYISSKDFTGVETAVFVLSDGVAGSEPAKLTFNVTGTGSTLNAWNFSVGSGSTAPDVYHAIGMKLSNYLSFQVLVSRSRAWWRRVASIRSAICLPR